MILLEKINFSALKDYFKKTALGIMLSLFDKVHCVSHDVARQFASYLKVLKLFMENISSNIKWD